MDPNPTNFIVNPKSANGRAILVLHAWWGLNGFIKDFCKRLGDEGYIVLAPDLYRGNIAHTIEDAARLRDSMMKEKVVSEITRAIQYLHGRCKNKVNVVGFSLGGGWGLWLASQKFSQINTAIAFYSVYSADYAQSDCAYQFHLAENDLFEPTSEVDKMREAFKKAGKEVDINIYPGTKHWFFESERIDAYDEKAAGQAWKRMLAFIDNHNQ